MCPFIVEAQDSNALISTVAVLVQTQRDSNGKLMTHRTFCIMTPHCSVPKKNT